MDKTSCIEWALVMCCGCVQGRRNIAQEGGNGAIETGTNCLHACRAEHERALMEFTASDWVNVGMTEAILSREGPPLFIAAQRGCIAAVKVMTEAGSNLEVFGPRHQRPLHAAAAEGHAGIVATLLGAGCEIDPQDEDGNTPLIAAVLSGQAATVEILLAVGADPKIQRLDGMTAVHVAQLPGTPVAINDLMLLGQ